MARAIGIQLSGSVVLGLGLVRCEAAQVAQVALRTLPPAIGLQRIRNQQVGPATAVGRGAWPKAQPVPGRKVEGDHGVAGILLQPFAGEGAAD